MGKVDLEKWSLEFEVLKGWKPRSTVCWTSCPISPLFAPLGTVCPGMKPKFGYCPIEVRGKKHAV